MKNPKAAELVRVRLKYDWIVLFWGFLCTLIQFIYQGDLTDFFVFVGVFALVEIFEVGVYRKLKNGGEGYHMLTSNTLNQNTSLGYLLAAMSLELIFLLAVSLIFLVNVFK
jgi:hypothetical protein